MVLDKQHPSTALSLRLKHDTVPKLILTCVLLHCSAEVEEEAAGRLCPMSLNMLKPFLVKLCDSLKVTQLGRELFCRQGSANEKKLEDIVAVHTEFYFSSLHLMSS